LRALILLLAALPLLAQPQRIVSTAPSITEMLFALGLGNRVVGVTSFCHYPAQARQIPKIGSYLRPNIEKIASLRPDLVVLLKSPSRAAEQLRAMKLNLLELEHDTIDGIYSSIAQLGAATGRKDRAAALTSEIRRELQRIQERTAKFPKRRMMFIVGRNPGTLAGLVAVGKASYLNEVIAIAGGENVFRDSFAPYPKVSLEEVLARAPEVIVDMGDMAQTEGVTEEHKKSVIALWNRYSRIPAAEKKNVFAVASDIFVVPGPRVVEAARAFARMLHPEAGI